MSEQRVGIGVDAHPFVPGPTEAPGVNDARARRSSIDGPGRALVLGGVRFPAERPLEGHSDADVVAHAVSDALLGAAGLGDLGTHFPDTDDRWRGADSLELLVECAQRVGAEGWRLVNADCTVVAARPKIAPFRSEMAALLSRAAGGPVHVKATRPEGLGALGRVEGIACMAVALIARVDLAAGT